MNRLLFTLIALACSVSSAAEKDKKLTLAFLGDQGHHRPALRAKQLIPVMQKQGIDITYTEDRDMLNAETLSKLDGLIVYANIGKITPEQEKALLDYVAGGGGFVPLHCASYCFLNSKPYVELVGAQFRSHRGGTFRVNNVQPDHPIMKGFKGFESWDETYVHHRHNEKNRTVLEVREEKDHKEPWTWVRTHGKGRVFYTAWGHDQRTWSNPGFHDLVERGIRWACDAKNAKVAAKSAGRAPFVVPPMTKPRTDVKPFQYVEVGPKIPNYPPSGRWGVQADPHTKMQKPLSPEESLKHFVTPVGFRVELFADERSFDGKPIAMNWDERGRLWICETLDYPNELKPAGKGRDRIRICEDTNGDYRADKFTIFADKMSIPTSITFYRGGVIVQDGKQTLYLKDTDGDDKADVRKVLITGWNMGDTHGGVSNLRYGLDNWFWGMQGYNHSTPGYDLDEQGKPRKKAQGFRNGFFRFQLDDNDPPTVTDIQFMRSTNNNTWGLGLSEEGLVFGSTANRNPSTFMPIANRYYEQVRGWSSRYLGTIADTHRFRPITDKVRQVDQHGGYTAGAGHALYTARRYPETWWNRTAFVCGPTGHLVGTFVLKAKGAQFSSTNPGNLLASDDEWSAPIAAEVGPDGNVWVLDWYNFIIQHNPTPHGFKRGPGNAYASDLRDKKHGRILRVVYGKDSQSVRLDKAKPKELVAALGSDNMLWRLHAQRLLVERGKRDVEAQLKSLAAGKQIDDIGLNGAVTHALWTLDGLGATADTSSDAAAVAQGALSHASAGVRRNAIAVLPPTTASSRALLKAGVLNDSDAQVRQAALLKLTEVLPQAAGPEGAAIAAVLVDPQVVGDRWLLDAATAAAARHDVAVFGALASSKSEVPVDVLPRLAIVAEHFARGKPTVEQLSPLLATLREANAEVNASIIAGLSKGWPNDHTLKLDKKDHPALIDLLSKLPIRAKGELYRLSIRWETNALVDHGTALVKTFNDIVADKKKSAADRVDAARQLVAFRSTDAELAARLLDYITLQASPELATGLLQAAASSRAKGVGEVIAERLAQWTPGVKAAAVSALLSRAELTQAMLTAVEKKKLSLSELSLDQKQALAFHPNRGVRGRAKRLLQRSGVLPNADRQKVLASLLPLTEKTGDVALGKAVYKKNCSKCHVHSGEGTRIGPDLTGMAVHPKKDLLGHIIDPSASVEGNFRTYSIVTKDGLVLAGMLAGESRTALELIDAESKRHTILREDIEQLVASTKSLMPDGFEKQVSKNDIVNLLEFLTARGKFVSIDLAKAATAVSTKGMFTSELSGRERLIFPDWKPKTFESVPFALVDPQGDKVKNVVLLHGPKGALTKKMPKSVKLQCKTPAKAIHLLSGISCWGHPYSPSGTLTIIVRLHYADGKTEDHKLLNGRHFADYSRRLDVPKSKFAFDLRGQQVRYLAVYPKRIDSIQQIELVKGSDDTAPVVVAVTVEAP